MAPQEEAATRAVGSVQERKKELLRNLTPLDTSCAQSCAFRKLKPGEFIERFYAFGDRLHGGGSGSKVLNASRRSDGKKVVIKVRPKRWANPFERSWRDVMTQLHGAREQSAHVLDVLDILEDASSLFVVTPLCEGGDLMNFLLTEAEVAEEECKRLMREILQAVGHLHSKGLIHRDVKPENIMFDESGGTPKTIKLIDFDTCIEWTPTTPKSPLFAGTPGYIAPEALLGEASPQSDLWAVGVILYTLMTGETPWAAIGTLEDASVGTPSSTRMYDSLKTAAIDWDCAPWPDFSLARDLCQQLLAFDVEERLASVDDALAHPWLAQAVVHEDAQTLLASPPAVISP